MKGDNIQPIGANEAELYCWQATATIASITAGANIGTDQVQVLPDSYFCLMGFVASTNYDGFAGQWKITNVNSSNHTLYGPPVVPNNFEVSILQDNNYLFSGAPMPQSVIAGNASFAGHQLVFPILYKPLTQFQFTFYNTAQVLLDDSSGTPGSAVNLVISFGMFGYNIPVQNLSAFLCAWPAYQAEARKNGRNWISRFTREIVPGITA
jgi:hypothetical protein